MTAITVSRMMSPALKERNFRRAVGARENTHALYSNWQQPTLVIILRFGDSGYKPLLFD
jgi:hypothetical protein